MPRPGLPGDRNRSKAEIASRRLPGGQAQRGNVAPPWGRSGFVRAFPTVAKPPWTARSPAGRKCGIGVVSRQTRKEVDRTSALSKNSPFYTRQQGCSSPRRLRYWCGLAGADPAGRRGGETRLSKEGWVGEVTLLGFENQFIHVRNPISNSGMGVRERRSERARQDGLPRRRAIISGSWRRSRIPIMARRLP